MLTMPDIHVDGAYAPSTMRAIRGDWGRFSTWCQAQNCQSIPADPDRIVQYISHMSTTKKIATIRKALASIGHVHQTEGHQNPTGSRTVKMAIRKLEMEQGERQRQAKGLTIEVIKAIQKVADPEAIRDIRDLAMIMMAYDTMARRSELVRLDMCDISYKVDGSATILIRRSKTDQTGKGSIRYVSASTVIHVNKWYIRMGEYKEGPIWRGIYNTGKVLGRLSDAGVCRAIKRMVERAGFDPVGYSGHSCRIGAAQDQAAAGISLVAIQQAGGWRSPGMPARYAEGIEASRGGAAQLARIQGRS